MYIEPNEAQQVLHLVRLSPLMMKRYEALLQKQEEIGNFTLPLSEMCELWNVKKTAAWHTLQRLQQAGLVKYHNRRYRAV